MVVIVIVVVWLLNKSSNGGVRSESLRQWRFVGGDA